MATWLFVATKEDHKKNSANPSVKWNQRIIDRFWGLEERVNNRRQIKPNDKVVMYLGRPEFLLVGPFVLKSKFRQLSPEEKIRLGHNGNKLFDTDYGVDFEPYFDDYRFCNFWDVKESLKLFKGTGADWMKKIRGNGIVRLTPHDYDLILRRLGSCEQWYSEYIKGHAVQANSNHNNKSNNKVAQAHDFPIASSNGAIKSAAANLNALHHSHVQQVIELLKLLANGADGQVKVTVDLDVLGQDSR